MANGNISESLKVKYMTASVTVENGFISLRSLLENNKIPLFVLGTTGYIAGGTNNIEVYYPGVWNDNSPTGTIKTIGIYYIDM